MSDYFKTRTGARQLELVGNISGLLDLGDQSKVRVQQRCRSFDAIRRRTTGNPLVLLDAALR